MCADHWQKSLKSKLLSRMPSPMKGERGWLNSRWNQSISVLQNSILYADWPYYIRAMFFTDPILLRPFRSNRQQLWNSLHSGFLLTIFTIFRRELFCPTSQSSSRSDASSEPSRVLQGASSLRIKISILRKAALQVSSALQQIVQVSSSLPRQVWNRLNCVPEKLPFRQPRQLLERPKAFGWQVMLQQEFICPNSFLALTISDMSLRAKEQTGQLQHFLQRMKLKLVVMSRGTRVKATAISCARLTEGRLSLAAVFYWGFGSSQRMELQLPISCTLLLLTVILPFCVSQSGASFLRFTLAAFLSLMRLTGGAFSAWIGSSVL